MVSQRIKEICWFFSSLILNFWLIQFFNLHLNQFNSHELVAHIQSCNWSYSHGTIAHQWNTELFVLMNHFFFYRHYSPTTIFFFYFSVGCYRCFSSHCKHTVYFMLLLFFLLHFFDRDYVNYYLLILNRIPHELLEFFRYNHRIIGSNFQHFILVISRKAALNSRQISQITVHIHIHWRPNCGYMHSDNQPLYSTSQQ